jgi:hypothetical protein
MAKKQTFSDKSSKQSGIKTKIKLIRSSISSKGSIRFSEDMLEIPEGKTPDVVIKEFISSK